MTKTKRSLTSAALIVFFLLAAAPISSGAQAPDRSAAPKPGPAPTLRLPQIQKRALTNGLPVWIAELHEVPVVQVSLVVRAGGAADPSGQYGLASLTAAMLDEGAGTRSALEIADAVDYLGADLSTSSGIDGATVRMHVPVARLGDALPIMADVALRPTFDPKELDRLRQERLTSLLQARDNPAAIASTAFPRIVFGPTHRYGTSGMGSGDALRAFTPDDLRRFHARQYVPSNTGLIVVGDIGAETVVPLLEKAFGGWKTSAAADATTVPAAPQLTSRAVYLIDKPAAAQSQIRIGWVGVSRSTPDYFPIVVLNTILGGSFTSRLNQNLREQHGYAYGANSAFDMRASAGPFVAAAGVQTDKTAEALKEFFVELTGIGKPIPAEELAKAKNYIALGYPAEFETTRQIAGKLEEQFIYRLPDDYFSTFVARVLAVTADAVQRATDRYIQPDKFAVVVVGDRQKIEPGIAALNLGALKVVPLDEVMPK